MYSMWNAPSSDDYYGYTSEPEVDEEERDFLAWVEALIADEESRIEAELEAERQADMAAYYGAREKADFEEWVAMLEEDALAHELQVALSE